MVKSGGCLYLLKKNAIAESNFIQDLEVVNSLEEGGKQGRQVLLVDNGSLDQVDMSLVAFG